ncbi:hypothetical protein B5F74_02550 [Collinsella sp. An271]|uniref:hypothetical protein n=1 Tax=Collinsella sp. An271 TaxID=1965616 RepID=UPI000B391AF3|nr:hypothetical protein [Collinsella sp. An271]OUO62107.1 hypothetical protein B5F74_02550 [Collinsella sp. An271]
MSDERTTKQPGVWDEDIQASDEAQEGASVDDDEAAETDAAVDEKPKAEEPLYLAEDEDEDDSDEEDDAEGDDPEDSAPDAGEPADDETPAEDEDDLPADLDEDGADEADGDEPDAPHAAADDAEPEYYGSMPRFLTREEYENFGDDPEPLPEGFEVIEGGAGNTGSMPPVSAAPSPAPTEPEQNGPSRGEHFARAASEAASAASVAAKEAASTVNAFIRQGVGAVREMSDAKRAHAEAREQLEELKHRITDQTAELEHRRDVTERYPEIIQEQTTRKSSAAASIKAAQALQKTIQDNIDMLKKQLDDMRASDEATEKRLKSALEAAENREESARDAANRLKRRLSDAQRAVEKAQEAKATNIETAQHAVEAANARLNTLREEYAELQRNPSANSAAYSVRDNQLSAEIADATEELRRAKENLPRVTADAEATLLAAKSALAEAERPVAEAKDSFRGIADETGNARDALEASRKEAADRQKALKSKISEQERAYRDQQRAQEEAQAEIADADDTITKAAEIHDNPDVTDRIAASLAADTAEHDELMQQVQALAETEANVRERTRDSRVKFIGAIAAVIVVIVIIAAIWFALT